MTKTLKENWGKMTKILLGILDQSNRERKSFESFEIVFEHVRNKVFIKLSIQFSIDKKLDSINWKCLRLIQKQSSSDWNDQIQTKILITFFISRETVSIDRKSGKHNFFLKNRAILCKNSSKYSILWIKCMSMR